MNAPVSVGIVGLGAVVRNIHMPAYAQLKGRVRVIAGCDPNAAARQHAQDRWGLRVFASQREMLGAVRPDVAAICTPPWLHQEQVRVALEHGCHVFCEKPLAEDLGQADDMVEASRRARRLVVVNNQFPYMNIHSAAKRMIGSPQFGELLYLHVWHTMHTNEITEARWRGELTRRLCFEFGTHVFELVRFLFGDNPIRLLAHMPNPLRRSSCDTVNVIALEFADGRGVSIVMNRISRGPERYLDMRLDGEQAAIHTSIGGRVRIAAGIHTREKRPYLEVGFVKGGRAVLEVGTRSTLLATDGINPFANATARHFATFVQSIGDGSQPPGGVHDNRDTLALVMAAYESAESGTWVHMHRYLRPAAAREAT